MSRRIHDVLDGERPRCELTAEECDSLSELADAIDSVVGPLIGAPAPDLKARVMERIVALPEAPARARPVFANVAARLRHAITWLATPRPVTIQLRPAYAGALFGLVALVMVLASDPGSPSSRDAALAAGDSVPHVYVQFRLDAEGASSVALAGSFTSWRPDYELREIMPGTWSILIPLRPGVHDYAFIVDGKEWVADPHALQIDDGFGGVNSRIALPLPAAGRRQS